MKLTGVAAIVTGGGSGLGRATAEALAAKGAKVTVFDLNPAAAEEAAKAVGGLAVAGDVADETSAGAALAKAAAAHGAARVLVNCAGIGVAKRVVGREKQWNKEADAGRRSGVTGAAHANSNQRQQENR